MFGILFTYILGSLLILLSFTLEPPIRYLYRRRHYRQYQYLEWHTNSALQLRRLAQDELGYGQWAGCADPVPVTRRGDLLAGLDVRDVEYPRLNRDVIVKTEESRTSKSESKATTDNEPGSTDSPRKKNNIGPSASWASRATLLWQKTFVSWFLRFGSRIQRDPGISVAETNEAPVSLSTAAD